jgi:hypothetical protein
VFIIFILLLLAPAFISVFLFEKFKGFLYPMFYRIVLLFAFALLINMGVYFAIWLWGLTDIAWTLDHTSSLTSVSFCLRYMALALLFSCVLPFILSLVRIGKRK